MLASSEPFHLSGRNAVGSGPYRSLRRCMWYTEYATGTPSRTKSGERPSGPPPTGRVVVFLQNRVLIGTGGYNRRAASPCQRVHGYEKSTSTYFLEEHYASRAFAGCALSGYPFLVQQWRLFHDGVFQTYLGFVKEGNCKPRISAVSKKECRSLTTRKTMSRLWYPVQQSAR